MDFQAFWRKNESISQTLTDLAKKVNIICATSSAAESAFSVAGFIQRKHRSNLKSKRLRFSILLREKRKIRALKHKLFPE